MIIYAEDTLSDEEIYSQLRPYVASWFRKRFTTFTAPQRLALPYIKREYNVLISSPTGTGKTLAAFLAILDYLFMLGEQGLLEDKIYVVYVSPLRALNNDMRRNLMEPLKEIKEEARRMNIELPEIKIAVRTSDTSPTEKQKMTRNPPHILITTPESLTIALSAPKFGQQLARAEYVIIDEIHELAGSKRGALLSLAIERLEAKTGRPLKRIGLSATIAPLEEIARFLVGYQDNGVPRPCVIADARFAKPIDIRVVTPVRDLINTDTNMLNESIYKTLARLIKKHRTTLVFTNTRSATERVVYKLRKMLEGGGIIDSDKIEAHHSSLSRSVRLDVEERLKKGELRVVVSSTSLELGIDIGYIDLVVLLSSPKSVSRLLQRIGRAGHHIRQVSKGRIIVVDRDDLVECTVLAKAALERKIDKTRIPRKPLDILAQHIVGMSLEKKWKIDDAYKVVKRSYNYHDLSIEEFEELVRFLAGFYSEKLEALKVYSKIWYDPEERVFGRKKTARMIYYTNSGAIPDEAKIHVFTTDHKYVGDLDEGFVQILTPGDIFVLGGHTYEYIRSEGMKIIVRRAEGVRPTVPSWFSEMLPLAFDSALEVGKFRRIIAEMLASGKTCDEIVPFIMSKYRVGKYAALNICNYIKEQWEYTEGIVPSDKLILIEIYDEDNRRNIIFHSLLGRRTNDALSRAYALVLSKKTMRPVRTTITDNGFMLTVSGRPEVNVKQLVKAVTRDNIRELLKQALRGTELLKRRFRYCAERSFMILKRYYDYEKSPHRLQLNAEAILRVIESIDPNFPILREAYREIMEDFMDIESAEKVLEWVEKGDIDIKVIKNLDVPSPFAHSILSQGYSDIVLMEDKRRLIRELHERVLALLSQGKKPASLVSVETVGVTSN